VSNEFIGEIQFVLLEKKLVVWGPFSFTTAFFFLPKNPNKNKKSITL